MATDLDQFGQYLQQLHPHCKNGLSQMDCRRSPPGLSNHWKFLERFIIRIPSLMMFIGLVGIQKGLVAVTFTGSPFNHVNAKTWRGTCVAPMHTFLRVWSVTQTSIVQQSEGSYKTDVRRGQTNLSISFAVARLLTKQLNAPCNLLLFTWHCAVI